MVNIFLLKRVKLLDVTYKVRYILDNKPDKSGINDFRYNLNKRKNYPQI